MTDEPPVPGAEGYPLESAPDAAEAPLGADPPPPRPPCPACGAPRRRSEDDCLQCGHGLPAAASDVAAPDPEGDAETAPEPRSDAPPTDPAPDPYDPDAARDPDLEPLLRSWPRWVDDRVTGLLAGLAFLSLTIVGLTSDAAFPPARIPAEGGVSLIDRLELTLRLLGAAAAWGLAATAAALALAWAEDRPVGGRVPLALRCVLFAAVSRQVLALPIEGPRLAFVVEGLACLAVLAVGLGLATRASGLRAALMAGGAAVIIGSTAFVAQLLAWLLA